MIMITLFSSTTCFIPQMFWSIMSLSVCFFLIFSEETHFFLSSKYNRLKCIRCLNNKIAENIWCIGKDLWHVYYLILIYFIWINQDYIVQYVRATCWVMAADVMCPYPCLVVLQTKFNLFNLILNSNFVQWIKDNLISSAEFGLERVRNVFITNVVWLCLCWLLFCLYSVR